MGEVRYLVEAKPVSGSRFPRMSLAARANKPVTAVKKPHADTGPLAEMLSPEVFDLIRAFRRIPDARLRRHVLNLVKDAAAGVDEPLE